MGETDPPSRRSKPRLQPGLVLANKYRLERELGRGGMGTVWAAVHQGLGQLVAIKLILAEHAQSQEARERFDTEAKAAARLRSRHVVQVFDNGETPEGMPFIVMEYLEGETLEARMQREGTLSLADAVRVTGQVARALVRAHAQGIVHRDLKPANIFLSKNDDDEPGWTAKVLDFGVAKLSEERDRLTTQPGTVLGTPLFMSAEQVRGASSVDHRADLYSLGMCFYHMLTGQYAFFGETFNDVLVAICTEPLPSLRTAAPQVPAVYEAFYLRCCARDPRGRYQSARELLEALERTANEALAHSAGPHALGAQALKASLDERLGASDGAGLSRTQDEEAPPRSLNRDALFGADESGDYAQPAAGPFSPSPVTLRAATTAAEALTERAPSFDLREAVAGPFATPPPAPARETELRHSDGGASITVRRVRGTPVRVGVWGLGVVALVAASFVGIKLWRNRDALPRAPVAASLHEVRANTADGVPSSTEPTPHIELVPEESAAHDLTNAQRTLRAEIAQPKAALATPTASSTSTSSPPLPARGSHKPNSSEPPPSNDRAAIPAATPAMNNGSAAAPKPPAPEVDIGF
ncbi:MAG TPA: serine/threonine-protein kinase [Polyangiaceae bacterium]|nr:serine/threonine-protein kinase [Polyangiaceae bacterium]